MVGHRGEGVDGRAADPAGGGVHPDGLVTQVERAQGLGVQEDAGVLLDAETLGALYLGDQPVGVHAAASRVRGPAVDTFAAMADHAGPTPWCSTGF